MDEGESKKEIEMRRELARKGAAQRSKVVNRRTLAGAKDAAGAD